LEKIDASKQAAATKSFSATAKQQRRKVIGIRELEITRTQSAAMHLNFNISSASQREQHESLT
jgi:hypothetical protein